MRASSLGPGRPTAAVDSSMASGSRPAASASARTMANSSASSSIVPLPGKNPSPRRPARRAATRRVPADDDRHRAVGRAGPHDAVARRRRTARRRSTSRRRRSAPTARAARRCTRRAGRPAPRTARRARRTPRPASRRRRRASTRPPDRWSSVAISLAVTTTLRCGSTSTPVAEADALGVGGGPRQPDQRVGQVERLGAAGHLAARVVRVLRLVARRHDDVLDGPQRLEAAGLGGPGDGDRRRPATSRTRCWRTSPRTSRRHLVADRHALRARRRTASACSAARRPARSTAAGARSSVSSALSSMRASIAPRQ